MGGGQVKNDPELEALFAEVTGVLEYHHSLVKNAQILSDKDKQEHEKRNAEAVVSFAKRQAKITFVGAMKSGKSTCVNACTGVQVLPARAHPMTTVPTTISHNPRVKFPEMLIPENLLSKLNDVLQQFRALKGDDSLPEHLSKFVKELEGIDFLLRDRYVGTEEIGLALFVINDLVRMCADLTVKSKLSDNLVEVILSSLDGLSSLPQIETQFLTTTCLTSDQPNGMLTLVDSPGPDEIRMNDSLARVNREILTYSDAICLVLNARTLGNAAEAAILKMVLPFVGSKTYVILNQVDDEATRDSAIAQFLKNVEELNATVEGEKKLHIPVEHIFPMSALQATKAMMFTKYQIDNPKTKEMPSDKDPNWRNFYQLLWGTRWERQLKKSSVEELEEDCKDMYAKSNTQLFLTKVVQDAINNASVRCAAGIMRNILQSSRLLKKRVNNQVTLFESQKDLGKMEKIRKDLQTLSTNMDTFKKQAQDMQTNTLTQQYRAWDKHSQKMKTSIEELIEGGPCTWLSAHITSWYKEPKKYFGTKKISGNTKEEVMNQVQPVLDELRVHVVDVIRCSLLKFASDKYINGINQIVHDFNNDIVVKARDATAGLKQLNIRFAFPKRLEVPTDAIQLQLGNIALPSSHVTTTKEVKRAWWWFFTLVSWEETQQRTVFELDPALLRDNIKAAVATTHIALNELIHEKMSNSIPTLFDPFFVSTEAAIKDVSMDMDKVAALWEESTAEIELAKENAHALSESLSHLEMTSNKLQQEFQSLERKYNS